MTTELGLSMLQICEAVPDGVVLFFTSYDRMEKACEVWQRTNFSGFTGSGSGGGGGGTVWQQIKQRKAIFIDEYD